MEENWNDKEFVLDRVKKDGFELKYASEELKNDKEVVLEAVKAIGEKTELKHELENVLNRGQELELEEILLDLVKAYAIHEYDTPVGDYVSEKLRNNKEFMIEVVKQDGYALEFAGEEQKNNTEVVLEAGKQDGYALKFAGKKFVEKNSEILKQYSGVDIQEFISYKSPDYEEILSYDEFYEEFKDCYLDGDYDIYLHSMNIGEEEDREWDKEKLENACKKILKKIYKKEEFEDSLLKIEEVEEIISDRRLSDVNKATNKIIQANEEKEQNKTDKEEHSEG